MKAFDSISRKGLTILECLALVAIVCILAAMIGPGLFQDSCGGRSKVSRVRTDHRSIATAIEAYYVDFNSYPRMRPLTQFAAKPKRLKKIYGDTLSTIEPGSRFGLGLTTPIAYVTSLFPDPFEAEKGLPFAYYVPPDGKGWILLSPGPDEVFNFDPATLETVYDTSIPQPSLWLLAGSGPRGAFTYDPTNGTVSDGDLWRVKQ